MGLDFALQPLAEKPRRGLAAVLEVVSHDELALADLVVVLFPDLLLLVLGRGDAEGEPAQSARRGTGRALESVPRFSARELEQTNNALAFWRNVLLVARPKTATFEEHQVARPSGALERERLGRPEKSDPFLPLALALVKPVLLQLSREPFAYLTDLSGDLSEVLPPGLEVAGTVPDHDGARFPPTGRKAAPSSSNNSRPPAL